MVILCRTFQQIQYLCKGKDKNKTPHLAMQGLIFLCRSQFSLPLFRINFRALRHVLFLQKFFNTFADFNLSSSFPFFFPNQKQSLSKNHLSIAPTPNHLTEKRKKEEETSSFPLFSPISPIQYNPSALHPYDIRVTYHLSPTPIFSLSPYTAYIAIYRTFYRDSAIIAI